MKTLSLSNGLDIEFNDESTISHLTKEASSFSEVDSLATNITEENLAGATFDSLGLEGVIPVSCSTETNLDGTIHVTFITRQKTEIEMMKDEITELQEALAEIAGGE